MRITAQLLVSECRCAGDLRMLHERFRMLVIPSYEDIAYQNPAVIIGVRRLPVEVRRP